MPEPKKNVEVTEEESSIIIEESSIAELLPDKQEVSQGIHLHKTQNNIFIEQKSKTKPNLF